MATKPGAIQSSVRYQRYYDPTIGRFLSTDPIQANANTGASFNRYDYANNSPYRFTDPDGRDSASCYGDGGCGGNNSFYASREKLEGLAGLIPGVDLGLCAKNGCGAGGWVLAAMGAIPGDGKIAQGAVKAFSKAKQLLVEMAKLDKKVGMIKADMEAYKALNKELPDPFPENKVRGPEQHPNRPYGKEPHGHVGPVDHMPIKDPPPPPPPKRPEEK